MSDTFSVLDTSTEGFIGKQSDSFGFFLQELAEVLSQDDDFLPLLPQNSTPGIDRDSSSPQNDGNTNTNVDCQIRRSEASLFCGAVGANLSDFKKEKMRSLLHLSLFTFTQKVDEMVNPVLNACRMQSCLRDNKNMSSLNGKSNKLGDDHNPPKKRKVSNVSSDSCKKPIGVGGSGEETPDMCTTKCEEGNTTDSSTFSTASRGSEMNDDLLFMLKMDSGMVEKSVKTCSDELFETICYMEQKLEEYMDLVMSKCRPMTLLEKQKLGEMIQDLPPKNMDRAVEIIQRSKPLDRCAGKEEILIDLDNEKEATLWRLYYYVEAVENAGKLSESKTR